MQRVKILLSYDGSQFHGFQVQRGRREKTVAGDLEKTFKKLGITSNVIGSGRTDKGVHASGQVFHVDIPDFWQDLIKLKETMNTHIHPHIHIKAISFSPSDFHARFFAKKRLYRYFIYTGEYNPFYSSHALHVKENFSLNTLNKALKCFEGEHSFTYFKKEGSDNKGDIRKIYKAGAYKHKNFIVIYIKGNSFLRSQVRLMSAFALNVAQEKLSISDLKEQLCLKKVHLRQLTPAGGLYLSRVYY